MKTKQHTAAEIIRILAQADPGVQPIGVFCREHGIAEATFAQGHTAGATADTGVQPGYGQN